LGIGDGGLGIGPNPQSPIPNPQSPIPNPRNNFQNCFYKQIILKLKFGEKFYNNLLRYNFFKIIFNKLIKIEFNFFVYFQAFHNKKFSSLIE